MPDDKKVITDMDEALEAGYFGYVPDETPNEAYTVAGVTSGDEAARADRRAMTGQTNIAPDLMENPNPQTAEAPKEQKRASGSTKKSD